MMSVFRTLNQRGHDPMNTIISAVKTTWRLVHCRHYRHNLLPSAEVLHGFVLPAGARSPAATSQEHGDKDSCQRQGCSGRLRNGGQQIGRVAA